MVQCPSCFAEQKKLLPSLNVLRCDTCGKHYRLRENDWVVPCKIPETKASKGDIQVGITGMYEHQSFTITGRFLARSKESAFNYWTLLFQNGDVS